MYGALCSLETFLSGMETSGRMVCGRALHALKPSLVEWKRGGAGQGRSREAALKPSLVEWKQVLGDMPELMDRP